MVLAAIDIAQQSFDIKFRGYDPQEVQKFLEKVAHDYQVLKNELAQTKAEAEVTLQQLRELQSLEQSLRKAMVTAQQAIDNQREQAKAQAELLRQQAGSEREQMLRQAQQELSKIKEETRALQQRRLHFAEEMRSLVQTYARLMDIHDEQCCAPTRLQNVHEQNNHATALV